MFRGVHYFKAYMLANATGISGLAFARFYLDIHPEARLAVVEENSCVGGVWSSSEQPETPLQARCLISRLFISPTPQRDYMMSSGLKVAVE